MKYFAFLLSLATCVLAAGSSSEVTDSTTIYLEPIGLTASITPLVEIKYNPSTLFAEIVSYAAPELPSDVELVRLGVHDVATSSWKSSTSVTSAESFSKGYSPTIILSLDAQGGIIGVTCRSGKIDAGQTRDFGPKVKVVKMSTGKKPVLNKPIVVSPEGKVAADEPEKTLLQKYWWVLLGVAVLALTGGGGDK